MSANNIAGKKNTIFSVTNMVSLILEKRYWIIQKIKEKNISITHMDMTRFLLNKDAVGFV